MSRLAEIEVRYEALRERDRVIASQQSKQRMLSTFEHVLDEQAREDVESRLREALDHVRAQAHKIALDLARMAFVELEIDDLARINDQLRRFKVYLDKHPSECMGACQDLLIFLKEMREIKAPIRPRPPDDDIG